MSRIEVAPRAKLTVVFEGKEYPMTKPKLGVVADFEEKLDSAKAAGKPVTRIVMELVTKCGLPAEVVEELLPEELQAIVETLTPAKKN